MSRLFCYLHARWLARSRCLPARQLKTPVRRASIKQAKKQSLLVRQSLSKTPTTRRLTTVGHRSSRGEATTIADYNEAIRLNPQYALAYYNRGLARENKNQLQQALSDFKTAADLSPSDPDARKAVARATSALNGGSQEFSSSSRIRSTTGRIEALERLSKLRNSGAITKQEYEKEKKRVLGD